jgi:hypothetical protein
MSLCIFMHLPTAYLTTMALVFYVLVWTAVERNWRIAAQAAAGGALAILVTAIYWLPAAWEAPLVDQYLGTAASYSRSYLPGFLPNDAVAVLLNHSLYVNVLLVMAAIAALSAIRSPSRLQESRKSQRKKDAPPPDVDAATRMQTRLLLGAGVFAIFMVTGFSDFVVGWIPKNVEVVQYAW